MVDIAEVNEHYKESGYLLIDVRSPDAIKNAAPVGALAVSEEQLIQQAGELSQQYKIIYIICHKGITSQRLCLQLEKSHGNKFQSVQGGFEAWVHQGFAVDGCSHEVDVSRYERQIKLAEFGQGGQDKLKESHILVVGAGGLGSPALMYLTGCGIGTITVIDDDLVALHNLHRQVLYTEKDIGHKKAKTAKKRLGLMNSGIQINCLDEKLTTKNVNKLVAEADLVLDGSDNVATRYVINDSCKKHQTPWIYAAVSDFDVQMTLFTGKGHDMCYRCLYPDLEEANIGNCGDDGVLGFVPGLAAMLQCTEAIKYLTGMGQQLGQKLLTYDVLNHRFKMLKYPAIKTCKH